MKTTKNLFAALIALVLALSLGLMSGAAYAKGGDKGNKGGKGHEASVKVKDAKVKVVFNEADVEDGEAARVKLHAARLMTTDVVTLQHQAADGTWTVVDTAALKCPKGKKVKTMAKGKVKEGKCTAKLRVAAVDGEWKGVVTRGDKTFETGSLTVTGVSPVVEEPEVEDGTEDDGSTGSDTPPEPEAPVEG